MIYYAIEFKILSSLSLSSIRLVCMQVVKIRGIYWLKCMWEHDVQCIQTFINSDWIQCEHFVNTIKWKRRVRQQKNIYIVDWKRPEKLLTMRVESEEKMKTGSESIMRWKRMYRRANIEWTSSRNLMEWAKHSRKLRIIQK